MYNSVLKIGAYNFNLEIDFKAEEFRDYIMDVLEQQFRDFDNVKVLVVTIQKRKERKEREEQDYNLLSCKYRIVKGSNSKHGGQYERFNTLAEVIFDKLEISDEKMFFKFYKSGSDYGDKVFLITKDDKEAYKNIEDKFHYCKVFDARTLINHIGSELESQIDNKEELKIDQIKIFGNNCPNCDAKNLNSCFDYYNKQKCDRLPEKLKVALNSNDADIHAIILNAFERNCILLDDINYNIITFSYFFLNQYIGNIGIVFDDYSFNTIESYVSFLSSGKNYFFNGLVNNIADTAKKIEGRGFEDFLRQFINLEEINDNTKEIFSCYFKKEIISNPNDRIVFFPLVRIKEGKDSKLRLCFMISYRNKKEEIKSCYEYKEDLINDELLVKKKSFELVSHIQWLWDLWNNR